MRPALSIESMVVLAVILGFCLFILLLSKEEEQEDVEIDIYNDDDDDGPRPNACLTPVAA